ncbi:unnamed protein product [Boreogadus saida]
MMSDIRRVQASDSSSPGIRREGIHAAAQRMPGVFPQRPGQVERPERHPRRESQLALSLPQPFTKDSAALAAGARRAMI